MPVPKGIDISRLSDDYWNKFALIQMFIGEYFMLKKFGLAAGALALVGTPIALQATERASAPVSGEQELGGSGALIGAIAAAVLVGFIVLTATDDDEPVSP